MINQEQRISHQESEPKPDKALSENGSTNQSDGTIDDLDEDLAIDQKQKFEFINESVENWPQWTVKDVQEKDAQSEEITAIKQ